MKIETILKLIILLVILSSCNSSQEEQVIKDRFNEFQTCFRPRDGALAYSMLDLRTKEYYSEILYMAKYLPKSDLEKLSVVNKIEILKARHGIEHKLLADLNGKGFFIHSFDKGLIWGVSPGAEIEIIDVKDDFALAYKTRKNGELYCEYFFRKENGVWKIDLTSQIYKRGNIVTDNIKKQKKSENEFILYVIEGALSKDIDDTIWLPIKRNL